MTNAPPNPAPNQVWWHPRLQLYAVVTDIWGRAATLVLLSPVHGRPPRTHRWDKGAPEGWEIYYQPGKGTR